ncbi:MAG TPA: type II toxin-antitoxin system death-on-curing family toxin [Candidatus Paceibacterota bacterium]|nr:type II toxin-antitoxin system death-on-curing family toxin [Candidatus Paceibacterota bacterium]
MRIESLSVEEVKLVAHALAQQYMEWGEPIPYFSTRFPEVLERCLAAPHQTFSGQLYKGLVEKASILFYLMIKNHPFQNGNKRIAVLALLCFLYKNNSWLKLDNQRLYNFARWVAESDATLKDATVSAIQKMVGDNIIKR